LFNFSLCVGFFSTPAFALLSLSLLSFIFFFTGVNDLEFFSLIISKLLPLATKAAVDQHYTKDSQDMKDFKSQMSAALITQSVGAKFALKGNVKDVKNSFDTEFLKDAKQGMKAVRSSAKIANIVANGKSFEMIKEKNSKPLTPVKKNIKEKSERLNKAKDGVEKKPTQREKLNKQRTNAKEKGRSSR
jgi:hypothetical protein